MNLNSEEMIFTRPIEAGDIEILAKHLRQADIQEITATTNDSPFTVLQNCVLWSSICHTIVSNSNKPLAIFGIAPDPERDDTARVWLLGSEELATHSFFFLRNSSKWIEKFHQEYSVLWNYIDVRNKVHIRWLKWCGFNFIRRIDKHGIEKRSFYEFEKRNS